MIDLENYQNKEIYVLYRNSEIGHGLLMKTGPSSYVLNGMQYSRYGYRHESWNTPSDIIGVETEKNSSFSAPVYDRAKALEELLKETLFYLDLVQFDITTGEENRKKVASKAAELQNRMNQILNR